MKILKLNAQLESRFICLLFFFNKGGKKSCINAPPTPKFHTCTSCGVDRVPPGRPRAPPMFVFISALIHFPCGASLAGDRCLKNGCLLASVLVGSWLSV